MMQRDILRWLPKRPYPNTILFDQYDFALATGWVSVLILCFALHGLWKHKHPALAWVILGLVQIEVVAFASLMPGETARLWTFLLPLLLLPIGWELARWDLGAKLAVMLTMWLVLTVMTGRMQFVMTEPLDKLPAWVLVGR
jgi:hypothetical protein